MTMVLMPESAGPLPPGRSARSFVVLAFGYVEGGWQATVAVEGFKIPVRHVAGVWCWRPVTQDWGDDSLSPVSGPLVRVLDALVALAIGDDEASEPAGPGAGV